MDPARSESQDDRNKANEIRQQLIIKLKECQVFYEMIKDNVQFVEHIRDYKLICGSLNTEYDSLLLRKKGNLTTVSNIYIADNRCLTFNNWSQ